MRIVGLAYIPYALMFTLSGILAEPRHSSFDAHLNHHSLIENSAGRYFSVHGYTGHMVGLAISPGIGAMLNYLYFLSGRWKSKVITGNLSLRK